MKTVRLPHTEYTPHSDEVYSRDLNTLSDFPRVLELRKAAEANLPQFRLHDGPPYANGHMHLGHALNKVMKDALSRSHFLMGYSSLFRPGWDCHGLPTEWAVQKQLQDKGRWPVSALEFREECAQFAGDWQKVQSREMQSLGVMAKWDEPYLTMSHEGDAGTLAMFHRLVMQGRVYRGFRPSLWSVPEQTALADAEVEEKMARYLSLLVRFRFDDESSLVVWTSTPWSLPGNRMVAVGRDFEYTFLTVKETAENSLLKVGETLVVSSDAVSFLAEKAGLVHYEVVKTCMGSALEGVKVKHPLYDDERRLYHGDFVKNAGTAAVHVAPSLSVDDFNLAKEYDVPLDQTLNGDGRYHASVPVFGGQVVMHTDGRWGDAQGNVMNLLYEKGNVVASWNDKHMAPHSWRSGAELLCRATTQYFVRAKGLVSDAMECLNDVSFNGQHFRRRMESMLENRPDWCVSRQRSWGVPLGLFVHKVTGELLTDADVLSRTQALFREHGSNCWYQLKSEEFLGDKYASEEYERVMDVLDVWFESGSTWSWVLSENSVADVYLEGSDQHRGWFQSSLLTSVAVTGHAPYKKLLTHGFVLDHLSRKMAKSKGNGLSPKAVMQDVGADVLRWTLLSCDTANDVVFASKTVMNAKKMVAKFGNTLKWLLGNMNAELSADKDFKLLKREQMLLARMAEFDVTLNRAFSECDLLEASKLLQAYCLEVSNVFVTMLRDTLYCDRQDGDEYKSAHFLVVKLFESLCAYCSVFMPFMAEQAWAHFRDMPHNTEHVEFVGLVSRLNFEVYENPQLLDEYHALTDERGELLTVSASAQKEGLVSNLGAMMVTTSVQGLDFALLRDMTGFANVSFDENRTVSATTWQRCERCRNWRCDTDVESGLCFRCSEE